MADIKPAPEYPQDIAFLSPVPQETASGSPAHLSALAAPTFEQTLGVAVMDVGGVGVGRGTVTIQAEAGQPGWFEGDVSNLVTGKQPGSIHV